MRENRTYGSEGGEGGTLSLPLSDIRQTLCFDTNLTGHAAREPVLLRTSRPARFLQR